MSQTEIGAPTTPTEARETQSPERRLVYGIMRRIDRRVERTLANPNLTPDQMQELLLLANLTKLALELRCLMPAVRFGEELVELSDPLMIPEATPTELG